MPHQSPTPTEDPTLTTLAQQGIQRNITRFRDLALGFGGVATVTTLAVFGLEPLITGLAAGSLTHEVVRLWLGSLGADALAGWLAAWSERASERLREPEDATEQATLEQLAADLQQRIAGDEALADAVAALVQQIGAIATAFAGLEAQGAAQLALLQALRNDLRRGDLVQGRLHRLLVATLDAQAATLLEAYQQGTTQLTTELRAVAQVLREEIRSMRGEQTVHTGGGPYVAGNLTQHGVVMSGGTVHGPVIGMAETVNLYQYAPPRPIDPAALAEAEARLATLPTNVVPAPAPLPPGSRMPLTPNPLFVGREAGLKTLARVLKSPASERALAITTGIGGVGKTHPTYYPSYSTITV